MGCKCGRRSIVHRSPKLQANFGFNDAGTKPNILYLATSFAEVGSLESWAQTSFKQIADRTDWQKLWYIGIVPKLMSGILNGLAYIHSRGVAHMDLCPVNIRKSAPGLDACSCSDR